MQGLMESGEGILFIKETAVIFEFFVPDLVSVPIFSSFGPLLFLRDGAVVWVLGRVPSSRLAKVAPYRLLTLTLVDKKLTSGGP